MTLRTDMASLAQRGNLIEQRRLNAALDAYAALTAEGQARFRREMERLTTPVYTGPNFCGEIVLIDPKDTKS